jgi:hypothetical protein
MEKFMDKLQVLDNSVGRTPDFRWHLGAPVVMAGDAFAIAW